MGAEDIPPRLSVYDQDYDPCAAASLVVRLDGVDQAGRAVAYDIDAGTVTRTKLNAEGYTYAEGDEIAVETARGIVTVERRA